MLIFCIEPYILSSVERLILIFMQEFYFVSVAVDLVPAEHCNKYGIMPAFYDKNRFPAVDSFEKIRYSIRIVYPDLDPHGFGFIRIGCNQHPNPGASTLTKITNKYE